MTRFLYDDGGRIAGGFSPSGGDCVTRAIAIASGREYGEVHAALSVTVANKGDADEGVPTSDAWQAWMLANGFAEGVSGEGLDYDDEHFKTGRYVFVIQIHGMENDGIPVGHAFAVTDGVVRDTFDYTKISKLYAYWRLEEAKALQAA